MPSPPTFPIYNPEPILAVAAGLSTLVEYLLKDSCKADYNTEFLPNNFAFSYPNLLFISFN